MIGYVPVGALLWLLIASLAAAQPEQAGTTDANRIVLGRLANGAAVTFVRAGSRDWGIEISGGSAGHLTQPKPAQIEVYRGGENVRQLAAGYQAVKQEDNVVVAAAKVAGEGQAAFAVEDRWKVSGVVLLLSRKVSVVGAEPNAGFYSAIQLSTGPAVKWEDVSCLVPGLLYGEPHGGPDYRAQRFTIREDYLSGAAVWALVPGRGLGGGAGPGAAATPPGLRPRRQRRRRLLMSAFSSAPCGARSCRRRSRVRLLAGSRNTGGWDRASEALEPTAPGCRGFPSTTCTASPAWKSSIATCINGWPKGIDVRRENPGQRAHFGFEIGKLSPEL